MQRSRYVFAILVLAASLAAGVYAGRIENPVLGGAAIIVAALATGFAVGYYSKNVIAPNLEKAQTSPAIRSGPLYWLLRAAMLAIALGGAGLLFIIQNRVVASERATYVAIAGGAVLGGIGLMIGVFVAFRVANRPGRRGGTAD